MADVAEPANGRVASSGTGSTVELADYRKLTQDEQNRLWDYYDSFGRDALEELLCMIPEHTLKEALTRIDTANDDEGDTN